MSAQGKQFKVNVSTPLGDAKTQTVQYPGTMYIPEGGHTIVFNGTIFHTLTEEEIVALQSLLEEDTTNLGLPKFDGVVESAVISDSTGPDTFTGIFYIKSEKQFAAGNGTAFPGTGTIITNSYHSTWESPEGYYSIDYYKTPTNKLFVCENKVYLVTSSGITEIGTSTGGGGGTNINTEASLEEAIAAGNDGVLYIPESEDSLAVAFNGKGGYVISAGEKEYIKALLDKELLSKYSVTLSATVSHIKNGWAETKLPTTYLEYGMKDTANTGMATDGYQELKLKLTIKYNNVVKDPATTPYITVSPSSTYVYKLLGFSYEATINPAAGTSVDLDRTSTGVYETTLYIKDEATAKVLNSDVFNASSTVKYTESSYGIELSKSSNTNIQCKKSKFIIDCIKGEYTLDNIKSLLEAGSIYNEPFLIQNSSIDPRLLNGSMKYMCRRAAAIASSTKSNANKLGAGANIDTFIISTSPWTEGTIVDAAGNPLANLNSEEVTGTYLNGNAYTYYVTYITGLKNDDSVFYIVKEF